jgi:hypothetical protein
MKTAPLLQQLSFKTDNYMKSIIRSIIVAISVLFISSCSGNQEDKSTQNVAGIKAVANPYWNAQGVLLNAMFPVDEIVSVTVTNFSGRYTLTNSELAAFKATLKKATYAGGLIEKPGHITLEISLASGSPVKTGFVYASKGTIHFDGATDQAGVRFSASFYLPVLVNFDNYK